MSQRFSGNEQDLQRRIETLETKLSKLDHRPSRLLRLRSLPALLLLAAGATGLALAQPLPTPEDALIRRNGDVTEITGPLRVVDASGIVLLNVATEEFAGAAVSVWHSGGGGLSVNSGNGVKKIEFGSPDNGAGYAAVRDETGATRISLAGDEGLLVRDAGETTIASVRIDEDGGGVVGVAGPQGDYDVAQLSVNDGFGVMVLGDPNGKEIIQAVAGGSETPGLGNGGSIGVFASDSLVAGIGSGADGGGVLNVSRRGTTLVDIRSSSNGGSIGLNLSNGTRTLTAGAANPATSGGYMTIAGANGDAKVDIGLQADGTGFVGVLENNSYTLELSTSHSGAGQMVLKSGDGEKGVGLVGARPDGRSGGAVVVFGPGEVALASILSASDNIGRISVFHEDAEVGILTTEESGAGSLMIANSEGKAGVLASGKGSESSGGQVTVYDGDVGEAAVISTNEAGDGEFAVVDKDEFLAVLTAGKGGAGLLEVNAADGTRALEAAGEGKDGSSGGSLRIFRGSDGPLATVDVTEDGFGRVKVGDKSRPLAHMSGNNEGGLVEASDDQGELAAAIGAKDGTGRVSIYGESDRELAYLGETAGGQGASVVLDSEGTVLAAMFGSAGGGAITVGTSEGTAAEMSARGGTGQFAIWQPGATTAAAMMTRLPSGGIVQVMNQSTNVGSLFVGSDGAGQIQLNNSGGTTMVEAGTGANGVGMVRAGPLFECAGTKMGLANPDCIIGRFGQ